MGKHTTRCGEGAVEDTHCGVMLFLQEEYFQQLELSSTLYIGNLSFYTTEDQVGVSAGRQAAAHPTAWPVMTEPGLSHPLLPADLRALWQGWGGAARDHGARQEHQDTLRLLFCDLPHPRRRAGSGALPQRHQARQQAAARRHRLRLRGGAAVWARSQRGAGER